MCNLKTSVGRADVPVLNSFVAKANAAGGTRTVFTGPDVRIAPGGGRRDAFALCRHTGQGLLKPEKYQSKYEQ